MNRLDAYQLLHEGAKALSIVEANGMRIDVGRLRKTITKATDRIGWLQRNMKTEKEYEVWRKRFGKKMKLGSRQQLGEILYGELGYKSESKTKKKKRAKVDIAALEKIDSRFVRMYLQLEKLRNFRNTHLFGVEVELVGEFIHPNYNLHTIPTYRSSCNNPNFQNVPVREPKIGKAIRSCFIARENHQLVGIDYSAHEWKIAACFWRDDAMVEYASDSSLDIHRNMASECYCLPTEEVPNNVRFYAKNQFVFPILYGSYYVSCARNLWGVIGTENLTTNEGVPLNEHLSNQGIESEDFELHVKGVEEDFNERFPTWSDKKEEWWNRYQKTGSFPLMTGFVVEGVYNRNRVMNYPVQGPAFHCLLWSMIRIVRWLRKNKMRTKIVGEVHDSIEADVHRDELDDYVAKAVEVMTVDVRKEWDWIITPLSVECAVSPEGGSWYDKK